MKKYLLLASCFLSVASFKTNAQTAFRRCGLQESIDQMLTLHPEKRQAFETRNNAMQQHRTSAAKTTTQVTIPVVFHIVLTQSQINSIGGAAGIKERVDSEIVVMNRDFNAANADSFFIPAPFKSRFGNAQIKFGLAHRKPDGTSTPGYEIVTTTEQSFSALGGGTAGSGFICSDAKYNISGGADAWDLPDAGIQYLNIWIVNFTETNLLGIAAPASFVLSGLFPEVEVGCCVNYFAFGKRSNALQLYISGAEGGRTLTHELGHVFELDHIWGNTAVGSGDCTDDDGISDTPQQEDANGACPNFPKPNCTNEVGGEMFMNYMDYVVDDCYHMFSTEQCALMNLDVTMGPASSMITHPELLSYPTSVAAIPTASFDVFPNPATAIVNIRAAENETIQSIQLTDVTGRALRSVKFENKISNYALDVNHLPAGVYMLQINAAEGVFTKKILLHK